MSGLTTCVKWIGKGDKVASVPRTEDLYDGDLQPMPAQHRNAAAAAAAAANMTAGADQLGGVGQDSDSEGEGPSLHRTVAAKGTEEERLDAIMQGYDDDDAAAASDDQGGPNAVDPDEDDIVDDVGDHDDGFELGGGGGSAPQLVSDAAYYRDNKQDPYMKRGGGGAPGADDDDNDSDFADLVVRPEDLLLCTAHTEEDGDWSHIDYEVVEPDAKFNNYVHHDLVAPAFPLCLEWIDWRPGRGSIVQLRMDYESDEGSDEDDEDDQDAGGRHLAPGMRPGEQGANLLAVGSFEPGIEIWDLDVLDALEPVAVLGGVIREPGQQPRQPMGGAPTAALLQGSHEDAVLGLSANRLTRQLLASASADRTVRVWDLQRGCLAATLSHHKDKVQSVAWHPKEPSVLLSGSYDRTAAVVDVRAAGAAAAHSSFRLPGDCEALAWDPHQPERFFVATDNGRVCSFNATGGGAGAGGGSAGDPVLSWQASSSSGGEMGGGPPSVTDLALHPGVAGILATCSLDGRWCLWDVAAGTSRRPHLLHQADMDAPLFSLDFCADYPSLLAVVGRGVKKIIDIDTLPAIQNHRSGRKRMDREGREIAPGQDGDYDDDDDDDDDESAHEDMAHVTPAYSARAKTIGSGGGGGGGGGSSSAAKAKKKNKNKNKKRK